MNIYDVLSKVGEIANKHKLIGAYHNGDVYRIMNSADNTYPTVVFTVDKLQDYEDYSTLSGIFFFVDRLTDDEDNKITIQSNGINVINDIVYKLGNYDGISPVTPLQYTFFTEKFGDMCCGVYANVSIQFTNYTKCCNNFNVNTLVINENGEYILDNIDVVNVNVIPNTSTITITENGVYNPADYQTEYFNEVTVDVQPALQNKTVEYTENGEYSVTNDDNFYGLKQVNINVSIPNKPTAVTITENGSTTLMPDEGYFNQVDIDVQVPDPALESKTVDITTNGTETITPDSEYGLSHVTINTNVQPKLQDTDITITENGSTEISKDDSYDGFGTVLIITNVQPNLQNKDVTITKNGVTTITKDNGYDGLGNVDINVNVPEPTTIDISIAENGTFLPNDFGGDYFDRVKVNVLPILQGKEVTITGNGVTTITKDEGFDGLNSVTVTTNVEGGGGSSIGNYIKIQTPFTGGKIIESTDSTLDITKWDLNIQQYNGTFSGLTGFNKIILPIDFFYIENKNDLVSSSIFENCKKLTEIENIDKTRISINSFVSTFDNCQSLTSLDLSYKPEYNYWDMSGVENIERMFNECINLTTLNIDGWDRAKISNSAEAFSGCNNLGGIIRLSAHNAKDNSRTFSYCSMINEIYYDNDGYDNDAYNNKDLCDMYYFAFLCNKLKKVSIKGRRVYDEGNMFSFCGNLEWVDMTGCDYSNYMSGNTSSSNIQPYQYCSKLKTLIGDHTLQEVENGDITIYNGLGLSQPRFKSYYISSSQYLRYSSMLALAKGLGQHTYSSTQYIRLNQTAWNNMYNDDDTIPDSNTITERQTTITDLITNKGWRIQYGTN